MVHTVFGGEPDLSLLEVLSSDDCIDTLRAMSEDGKAQGALASYCEELVDPDACAVALKRCVSSYNRYVMGLGSDRESHPWESAYTSSRKLLFQPEMLEVRNAYREFGYLPKMYPKVADDHIALECAFMAELSRKMLDADGGELRRLAEGQLSFIENHLAKWINSYADDLRKDAQGCLYSLVADALAEYVERDARFLRGLA